MTALTDEHLFAPTADDGIIAQACHYARCGLSVFPVRLTPANKDTDKKPPHGYLWKARATSKVNHVVEDFTEAITSHGEENVGIAWALGLNGYVALDLDGDEPTWWAAVEKVCAVNYTRRGRHIIARFPDGMTPDNGVSKFPTGGWGEARGAGGYIVIAAKDRSGFDAAQIDGLGTFPHPEWLTETGDTTRAATDAQVDAFIAQHTANDRPAALKGVQTFLEKWTPGGKRSNGNVMSTSRHDTAVEVACWIAREAATGHYPADKGFGELAAWWRHRMDVPSRRDGRELDSIIAWAIGQPRPEPVEPRTTLHEVGDRANVQPCTLAELGEDFWTSLPMLGHVRTAARARRVAPTAVLGAVLARASAFIPPAYCVPAFVGGTVPLSLIVALVGATSAGKSAPNRVAADLLPITPPGAAGPFALGSGEGAAQVYVENRQEKDDGRKVTRQHQLYYGVVFTLDEGRVLSEIGSRSGSTIVPVLCTMWTGGDPGRMNASAETRRSLPDGGYSFGLVSLWQPTRMVGLFDDTDGGLPGRFLFLPVADGDAPDTPPDWPGPLDWQPPAPLVIDGRVNHRPLDYPPSVAAEVDAARLAQLRGESGDPLDGHRVLNRLKVAGVLAELCGSHDVADVHWWAAGQLLDHSDAIRRDILHELALQRRNVEEAGNARAGRREIAKVTAIESKALAAAANAVGRKAHRNAGQVLPKRELTQAINPPCSVVVGC